MAQGRQHGGRRTGSRVSRVASPERYHVQVRDVTKSSLAYVVPRRQVPRVPRPLHHPLALLPHRSRSCRCARRRSSMARWAATTYAHVLGLGMEKIQGMRTGTRRSSTCTARSSSSSARVGRRCHACRVRRATQRRARCHGGRTRSDRISWRMGCHGVCSMRHR